MTDLELEHRVRARLFEWLEDRGAARRALSSEDLKSFKFEGAVMTLRGMPGIWKPKELNAALTIRTAYTAPGGTPPYADELDRSDGLQRYKWQGDDPDARYQRDMREARLHDLPLVWLIGIGEEPTLYQAIYPVYVIDEEPAQRQFVLAVDGAQRNLRSDLHVQTEADVRYRLELTTRRVHQPVFRNMVMHAYGGACAVCRLRHASLIDAANIKEDKTGGPATVDNGLALCKLHHSAFDSNILGIRPGKRPVVQVRRDVLEEIDGPMLLHGLQGRHGVELELPKSLASRPNSNYLSERYELFQRRG